MHVSTSHDCTKFSVYNTDSIAMPVVMNLNGTLALMTHVEALAVASQLRIAAGAEEAKPWIVMDTEG